MRGWWLGLLVALVLCSTETSTSSEVEHWESELPSGKSVMVGRRGDVGAVHMAGYDGQDRSDGRRQAYALSLATTSTCSGGTVRVSWSANPSPDFQIVLWQASSSGSKLSSGGLASLTVSEPHPPTGQGSLRTPDALQVPTIVVACLSTMDGVERVCSGSIPAVGSRDVCGVCGGNGTSCMGCDGVPDSGRLVDICGVCGGNRTCLDCQGVPHGRTRFDICGVCGGDGTSCLGCDGKVRSGKRLDACGVCGGANSTCTDCKGVVKGSARKDACGVCQGDNKTCTDCRGVLFGSSSLDLCGICEGDSTSCLGCDPANPGKMMDSCGVCGGGDDSCAGAPRVALPSTVCSTAGVKVGWVVSQSVAEGSIPHSMCLFKEPNVLPHQVGRKAGRPSSSTLS